MAGSSKKRATYEDVWNAPDHMVAEVIDGELYLQPRPAEQQVAAAAALGAALELPFERGRGGPGGWTILFEPDLHLGADILVPDLAGWRHEHMSPPTTIEPYFTITPDWLCEVLSLSTTAKDRARKLPIYAAAGVRHVWLVDPLQQTLEVLRLEGARWVIVGIYEGSAHVRAEPFDAILLDMAVLWANADLGD